MPAKTMGSHNEQQREHHVRTLLVVDDDALITVTLSSALRHAGYRVFEATSPQRALELCASHKFDLAILDQQMPGMCGIDLAMKLRELHQLDCIFLSAYSSEELVERAAEAGAISYLLKPVDPPNMLPAIRAALSRVVDFRQMRDQEGRLRLALVTSREVSVAVGVLMERLNVTHEVAFEQLRRYARSHRIKILDVARELLGSLNEANRLTAAVAGAGRTAADPGEAPERDTGP